METITIKRETWDRGNGMGNGELFNAGQYCVMGSVAAHYGVQPKYMRHVGCLEDLPRSAQNVLAIGNNKLMSRMTEDEDEDYVHYIIGSGVPEVYRVNDSLGMDDNARELKLKSMFAERFDIDLQFED